ncbi:MAG TPA: outer membrane protein assembly factor BamD [Longimicrobium sp.]|uniref:outer membrane protein assembly factor BamD n=1 Tax=Longimicrobium sp. TaxID=2029185 RepID=UPI002ED82409
MTESHAFRRAFTALAAVSALGGCSIFRTPPTPTPESSYAQGMQAYQARRYGRAAELLGQFVTATGSDVRLKPALMAMARSHMETGEFVTAGSEFLRVATEFPSDPEAVEARFGLCDAYHRLSPRPQLDQDYTVAAISYCESFAGLYPGEASARQATEWVGEMREKLATKSYQNGFFYFRRGLYDAGLVYFNEVLEQHPRSTVAPTALLRVVESYQRMGYREEEAAARQRLLAEYPQSAEARQAQPAPPAAAAAAPPSGG